MQFLRMHPGPRLCPLSQETRRESLKEQVKGLCLLHLFEGHTINVEATLIANHSIDCLSAQTFLQLPPVAPTALPGALARAVL